MTDDPNLLFPDFDEFDTNPLRPHVVGALATTGGTEITIFVPDPEP